MVKEPRLETSYDLQKPDLLIIGSKEVNVNDVQIRADSRVEKLDVFHESNCTKYRNAPLETVCHLRDHQITGVGCIEIERQNPRLLIPIS